MSIFQELRRRKVFSVAAAYAIVAWLLIQVAGLVFPQLQLPAWSPTLVTVLLILGFPVALVLAWAFELTPDGIRPSRASAGSEAAPGRGWVDYALLIGLVAVAGLIGYGQLRQDPTEARAIGDGGRPSIAVLPFEDMSPDGDQRHFGDGIADELLNELARLDEIDVASRTSSFAYRDSARPVPEIGRELGVRTVLEGGIRKDGDTVRVTAQLIDVNTGFHLYSQTYDRELTDIFGIQNEIARAVAGALGVQLGVRGANAFRGAGTESVEAYEAYLRSFLISDRAERVRWLERVVEMDPDYAAAWAELGLQTVSEVWEVAPEEMPSIIAAARPFVERAIEIDPTSASAHSLMGTVLYAGNEWSAGQASHGRAMSLAPTTENLIQNAALLFRSGRSRAALVQINAALSMQRDFSTPFSTWALLALRRYAEVDAQLRIMDEAGRQDTELLLALSRGTREDVRAAIEGISEPRAAVTELYAPLLEVFDDTEAAVALLHDVNGNGAFWASRWHDVSRLAAWYGDTEFALELVAEEARGGSPRRYGLWVPYMEEVRRLPEFKDLMVEINLVAYWREYGWGDHCQPIGDDDFECF